MQFPDVHLIYPVDDYQNILEYYSKNNKNSFSKICLIKKILIKIKFIYINSEFKKKKRRCSLPVLKNFVRSIEFRN